MAFGQIIAVRVFQNLQTITRYGSSLLQRSWFAEQFSSITAPELPVLTHNLDQAAAVAQTSSLRQEHTDTYGIERDSIYANRSRKWLYTRAYASAIDGNYQAWLAFTRMNLDLEQIDQFPSEDPDTLAQESFKTLLELPTS